MAQKEPLPGIDIARFSTDDVDPAFRFDAWNDNIGILFDLRAADGGAPRSEISASIEACNLGNAVFGVTTAQSQLFRRDDSRVRRDDMDHILVQVFLKGGGVAGTGHQIDAGDMLIIDLDRPHEMLNTDFQNLTLVLPRELDPHLSDLLAKCHGRRLGAENPMASYVAEHLVALWRHVPTLGPSHAGTALRGSLGLMRHWLSREPVPLEAVDKSVCAAIAKQIFRFIDQHLAEDLSAEKLAATFRVSRSQLYLIFAPHNGVARYILERRLRRSLWMLLQTDYDHIKVGAIGFACGFLNESHFSRTFRKRYGMSPSEARLTAAACADAADGCGGAKRELPKFAAWIKGLGA
jgi:AraC-like DNA-binding protein